MYRRMFFVLLVLGLSSLLITAPLSAQDAPLELTETFTSYDNWIAFDFPDGWVLDREGDDFGLGLFTMANTERALTTMSENNQRADPLPFETGDIGFILLRSSFITQALGEETVDSPVELLQQVLGLAADEPGIEISETRYGGYPVTQVRLVDEESTGLILLYDFGYDRHFVMVVSTTPVDFPLYEPTILAIADSVRFAPGAQQIIVHDYPVRSVEWNPDGRTFYTLERDYSADVKMIHVWDAQTGEELYQTMGGEASWNADGSQLIVFDMYADPTRVLDAQTGEELLSLPASYNATWSPDETMIVGARGAEDIIQVWDATTGEERGSTSSEATVLRWSADNTYVQITSYGTGGSEEYTQVIRAETGDEVLRLEDVTWLNWTEDGSRILYSPDPSHIQVSSFPDGKSLLTLDTNRGVIKNVYWLADEQTIIANVGGEECSPTSRTCDVRTSMWDASTGEFLVSFPDWPDWLRNTPGFTANGDRAVGVLSDNRTIQIWDTTSGEILVSVALEDYIGSTGISSDERSFMAASGQTVRIFDLNTGETLSTLLHDDEVKYAYWYEETLFVTWTESGVLQMWDAETGQWLFRIGHAGKGSDVLARMALSPDQSTLLTWISGDRFLRVWDAQTLIADRRATFEDESLTFDEYVELGNSYFTEGNFVEAINAYDQALAIDSSQALLYNDIAIAYLRLGNIQQALDNLDIAIEIFPEYTRALVNRGNVLMREGRSDEAERDFTAAIDLGIVSAEVFNDRGVARANQNNYAGAVEDITRAIELDPNYTLAFANRGIIQYFRGEEFYEAALADLQRYLELAGDDFNPDVPGIIAEIEAVLGNTDG